MAVRRQHAKHLDNGLGDFSFAFSNRLVAAADLNLWIIRITLIPYGDSQRI